MSTHSYRATTYGYAKSKGRGFPVKTFLAFHSPVDFDDDTFYSNSHTVCGLSVGDVQRCCAALDLAGEEWKIHPHWGYKVGGCLGRDLTHIRF